MSKINNKGFTLVELLGVLMILSIILVIAVPNVVSVLDKNKKETYVSDAKKLVSMAETQIRSDTDIDWPTNGQAVILKLAYLNNGDIESDPEGVKYDENRSYVAICLVNDTYTYYVQLIGTVSDGSGRGIPLVSIDNLNGDNRTNTVSKKWVDFKFTETEIKSKLSTLTGKSITSIVQH